MADNETITDIIAWLRKPREGENAYLTLWRDEIADRLDAAHKRERGNAAKLREALETLRELLGDLLRLGDAEYHNDFSNFCDIIDAALAAPPRNCDVGTAQEQSERMDAAYCSNRLCAKGKCPLFKPGLDCSLIWAQMPYVEKEGGAK